MQRSFEGQGEAAGYIVCGVAHAAFFLAAEKDSPFFRIESRLPTPDVAVGDRGAIYLGARGGKLVSFWRSISPFWRLPKRA